MRTDLSLAVQLVQVGHACVEAGSRYPGNGSPSHLVLFGVGSEARLLDAVAWLEAAGIRSVAFFEPDAGLGYTAACTEVVASSTRRYLRRFKLWNQATPEGATEDHSYASRAPPVAPLHGRAHS